MTTNANFKQLVRARMSKTARVVIRYLERSNHVSHGPRTDRRNRRIATLKAGGLPAFRASE